MINPQTRDLALTGKQLIRVHRPGREARLAIGIETIFPRDRSAGIGHDTGRTQMVFENEIERTVDPHGSAAE